MILGDDLVQRVVVYIDGFNLYYGLREKKWQRYYWLNIHSLSEKLLSPRQELIRVRYFTARIVNSPKDPEKIKRQDAYIEALEMLPGVSVHFGKFSPRKRTCFTCGARWNTYEEKMTDVNIAVEMLSDAQDNRFDTAIIVSGDSDLVGPIRAVRKRYPQKQLAVAFPPRKRCKPTSKELRKYASYNFRIGSKKLLNSQLPEHITKPNGYILSRPSKWR